MCTKKKRWGRKGALKRRCDDGLKICWNVENNVLWLICMYTYQRNIGPLFLYEVLFFPKGWILDSKHRWLFHYWLLKSHHMSWTSERVLLLIPLSQGLSTMPLCFLGRKSWSQPYHMLLDCPPAWSCLKVFKLGLLWGEDMWK
jgi:hypothetical protein